MGARKQPEPQLAGWGQLYEVGREQFSEDLQRLCQDAVLARGLGRSYGDSALPPPGVLDVATTTFGGRILTFDREQGIFRAEAGISIFEILKVIMPAGFFLPVTPGTQYVTLGGMVAADVHGKNHHVAGCIGQHIRALKILVASGEIIEATPDGPHQDLFWASIGGMGLLGHMLEVEIMLEKIPSPWIMGESVRAKNIEEFIDLLKEAGTKWPMTAGWIDCVTGGKNIGRGILFNGRWAEKDEAPQAMPRPRLRLRVPWRMPNWLLNRWTLRIFNMLMYRKHPKRKAGIVHYEDFYYPLDKILEWNKVYGKRGFTQVQFVLPEKDCKQYTRTILENFVRHKVPAFLCVIKDCGPAGKGMLSFPKPGISIALDIPYYQGIQQLIDEINEQVIAANGRIYLAKDRFTRPEHFRAMEEQRLSQWWHVKEKWDPERKFWSAQAERLLTPQTSEDE